MWPLYRISMELRPGRKGTLGVVLNIRDASCPYYRGEAGEDQVITHATGQQAVEGHWPLDDGQISIKKLIYIYVHLGGYLLGNSNARTTRRTTTIGEGSGGHWVSSSEKHELLKECTKSSFPFPRWCMEARDL